jgi:hypothetical protein
MFSDTSEVLAVLVTFVFDHKLRNKFGWKYQHKVYFDQFQKNVWSAKWGLYGTLTSQYSGSPAPTELTLCRSFLESKPSRKMPSYLIFRSKTVEYITLIFHVQKNPLSTRPWSARFCCMAMRHRCWPKRKEKSSKQFVVRKQKTECTGGGDTIFRQPDCFQRR